MGTICWLFEIAVCTWVLPEQIIEGILSYLKLLFLRITFMLCTGESPVAVNKNLSDSQTTIRDKI